MTDDFFFPPLCTLITATQWKSKMPGRLHSFCLFLFWLTHIDTFPRAPVEENTDDSQQEGTLMANLSVRMNVPEGATTANPIKRCQSKTQRMRIAKVAPVVSQHKQVRDAN